MIYFTVLHIGDRSRTYSDRAILPHIDRASTYTQLQLLNNTPPTNKPHTLSFVIPYNPDLTPLPHNLKHHWQYIENDPVLSQIWPNQLVMAYQRHKNLKEHFVCTKFTTSPITIDKPHHKEKPQPTRTPKSPNSNNQQLQL